MTDLLTSQGQTTTFPNNSRTLVTVNCSYSKPAKAGQLSVNLYQHRAGHFTTAACFYNGCEEF